MKAIEIIIDGKKYQAQMSVDEVKKLVEKPVRTGYERVEYGSNYYFAHDNGNVKMSLEDCFNIDDASYYTANYYSDKTLAENNTRADKLMRQLRRFAVEENAKAGITLDWEENAKAGITLDWEDKPQGKFKLSFVCDGVQVDCVHYSKDFGQIYFSTVENAKKAIDTFRDELLWYFTEYKDYYVGEEHNE